MQWRHVRISDNDTNVIPGLQDAFLAAYQIHLGGGQGLLRHAGIFQRHTLADRTIDLYFSPQMVNLLLPRVDALGAKPCDAPQNDPESHRHERLAMVVGEASVWELIQGEH